MTVHNYNQWLKEYMKQHPRNGATLSVFHSIGAVVFMYFTFIRGIWCGISGNDAMFMLICKETFCGLLFGFLICHTLPAVRFRWNNPDSTAPPSLMGCGCRYCIFSWDVMSNPWYCMKCEWEMIKDHILFFVVTGGRKNCLAYLYNAPPGSHERSAGYLAGKVSKRLQEINR
eukprot:170233_1